MSDSTEEPTDALDVALRYAGQLHMSGLSLTSAIALAAAEYSEEIANRTTEG